MVNPITAFVVAAALGFLAGLGVGGGSLLMLFLTQAMHTDVTEARVINLLFFLASAGIVSFFRLRSKKLAVKKLLPAIIMGCIASAAASLVSHRIETEHLSRMFGWLLIVTGLRELFYRPRKAR